MDTIKELDRTINCLMAHPDNKPNSEFADRIDSLIELRNQVKNNVGLGDVMHRRELLIALAKDFKDNFISCDRIDPEKYVDEYLSNL